MKIALAAVLILAALNLALTTVLWRRDVEVLPATTLYYELTIGSFTAVHAYGGFATYEDAQARVTWLKTNGYMAQGAAYFVQPRHLNDPLVVLDASGGSK